MGNKHVDSSYTMMDINNRVVNLEQTSGEKDVGVIIDEDLSFENHIAEKVNIPNRNMGIIHRSFHYLDLS